MGALYSRSEARDYLDVDTVLEAGLYAREELLSLADQREAEPMDRGKLAETFRSMGRFRDEELAEYGISPVTRQAIEARFLDWANTIDDKSKPGFDVEEIDAALRDAHTHSRNH